MTDRSLSQEIEFRLEQSFRNETAMRHGEVLKARFDQLDLDNLRRHIPEAKVGEREKNSRTGRGQKSWPGYTGATHAAETARMRPRSLVPDNLAKSEG